jgi:DivIVA domain-containing protein
MDGELTADYVHNVAFSAPPSGKRGYDEDEVDAFLERVEAQLRSPQAVGGLTAAEVNSVIFSKAPFGRRGYDHDEVDAFLERVAHQVTPGSGVQGGFPSTAEGSGHDTGSRRKRRDRLVFLLGAILLGGWSLLWLGVGVHAVYGYYSGPPTTATIVRCHGGPRNIAPDCEATWNIDGAPHTGTIAGHIGGYPAGSSLDVHVRGNSAYTTTSGYLYIGMGTLSGLLALLFVGALWRDRAGASGTSGRHTRR